MRSENIESFKKKPQNIKEKPVAKSIDRLKNVLQSSAKTTSRLEQYKAAIGKIVKIPIDDIFLNENVRKTINTSGDSFQSLLSSIKKHGIQQNIVVEFRSNGNDYKIVCISGHRRVLAAKESGVIETVPALIKQFDDTETRIELGLVENLLREDLHCLEIAEGYRNLAKQGWSRKKLSKTFGKTDRTIHSYLKMSEWSEKAKKIIMAQPDIFNAKTLTRKVACRKFNSDDELISTLHTLSSKTQPKTKNKVSKKTLLHEKLTSYLADKDYSPKMIRVVEDAFKDLGLI